ncbi:hypothetical protein Dimus_016067 [Dionaea muscipula]
MDQYSPRGTKAAAAGESVVIIIGAGLAGLSTAACLSRLSIPYIIIEREDCSASMWRKKAYDRLHLHLPKHFCELPHLPFPSAYPKYVPKDDYIRYIDDYACHFQISPLYMKRAEQAVYDEDENKWRVTVNDGSEEYRSRFLVVATGENTDPFMPHIEGLGTFSGKVVHSTAYRSGKEYVKKNVLVVGSGNSGMEIALDLANNDANTSIVIKSPIHVQSRRIVHAALVLGKYIPVPLLDLLIRFMSRIVYGNLTNYGISTPKEGPISMRIKYGKYPVIDVGTIDKIKRHEIQVLPAIASIQGNSILFSNGHSYAFDAIVLATGFRRSTTSWIKGDDYLFNEDGLPKPSYPNHWKGKNGLYCVGLARSGVYGIAADAENVANHINKLLLI